MKHSMWTKALALVLTFALLIPGGALLVSAECEHDFSVKKVVEEPTCYDWGYSYYYCSKCEEVEKDSGGEAIRYYTNRTLHEMIADGAADSSKYYTSTTNPTCEDWGVIDYYCEICDEKICDEDIEPLGHNGVWKIEQEATLDHPGVKSFVCSRCGEVLPDPDDESKLSTQEFELHEHCYDADFGVGYQRILTPATCTKDGEMGTFCGLCGALFAVEPIEATGHHNAQLTHYLGSEYELEEYIGFTNVVTTKPTCTEDGVITFLCDECGEVVRSYPLDKTGHYNDWLDWYLNDTDTTLEDCYYGRNVEYTEETCTKSGKLTFLCDYCGETMRSYTLEPTGHGSTYEKTITAATCTTAGEKGTYCADCGELLSTAEIEALGHDYGEWTPNGDKTHARSCSRCQFTDKANCKFNATVTDSTCTEGGFTTYVCSDCGYTYNDNFTDALGHDWSAWTDDANGESHSRVCNRCSETETEEHAFSDWEYNRDAKFFKNGTKSMTCATCGCVVTEKAQFTAWIWHPFYPLLLWIGTLTHKAIYLGSLAWFLPWLNIKPKM